MEKLQIKRNETFGEYAHRILDALECPLHLRERAHANITMMLTSRAVLEQMEEGKMVIKPYRSSYHYVVRSSNESQRT